jgi:hypothetical protein
MTFARTLRFYSNLQTNFITVTISCEVTGRTMPRDSVRGATWAGYSNRHCGENFCSRFGCPDCGTMHAPAMEYSLR